MIIYHNLLLKQVNNHLPEELRKNSAIKNLLTAVSNCYSAHEREIEMAGIAFSINEKEYSKVNKQLIEELALKRLSVEKLKETLGIITGNEKLNESDDLLIISRYLNEQISKRKNVEKVLMSLITNMQSGILLENENRNIVFTNQLFCDMFNIPVAPEVLQGSDCSSGTAQAKFLFKKPDEFVKDIENILHQKKLLTGQLIELADGRVYQRDYIPIFLENDYKGHLWNYADITGRKKAQDAIKQSELKNRLIMNSALDAIVNIGMTGAITFWNPQATNIFGWHAKDVIGKKLTETIIPVKYRVAHENGMKHFVKTGEGKILNKQIETTAINSGGIEFANELSIIPLKQDDTQFFCAFIRDISERKKYKEELERLSLVASANENGVVLTDDHGQIFWCNDGFLKISGYGREEVMIRTPIELMRGPLSNVDVLRKLVNDFYQGNSFNTELIQYRKDGSSFWGRSKGQAIRSKNGQVNYFAILEDISVEKKYST